jgi:PTS system ascorbate-specific IIA component
MGEGLIEASTHILGNRPSHLEALAIERYFGEPDKLMEDAKSLITRLDQGQGVLILADIYGASHTNAACKLLRKGSVELVTGVNLPMLVRVLNHRNLELNRICEKASYGGIQGIVNAVQRLDQSEHNAA